MPIDWSKVGAPEVLPERKPRSFSQLDGYDKCSYAFYLKRVLKLPSVPSVWLAGGSAWHKVTEDFDRAVYGQPTLADITNLDHFVDQFGIELDREIEEREAETEYGRDEWRAAGVGKTLKNPAGEDIAWWRIRGKEFVRAYIEWRVMWNDRLRLASFDGEPAIELKVLTRIGGVPVVGYIDRIFRDMDNGSLLLLDMKSGKSMPDKPRQLGQYALQIRQQYGTPISWGNYFDARKGALARREPIDLSEYTEFGLGASYAALDSAVEAGIFAPNVTAFCKTCEVKQFCYTQGGAIPADKLEGAS